MDTKAFFDLVLPAQGVRLLYDANKKKHTPYDTNESAAEGAAHLDSTGGHVYYLTGSVQEWKGNVGTRVSENIGWKRALYLDIDIGPDKEYQSHSEAIKALSTVTKELGFPLPLLVHSGGGMHAYWPFTDDVTAAEWKPVAEAFKEALTEFGFQQDGSVTADTTRILRPVGCMWKKELPFREVKRIGNYPVPTTPFAELREKLNVVELPTPIASPYFQVDGSLSAKTEYPPSSMVKIASQCPTIGVMRDTLGDVSYEHWVNVIAVGKYSIEGVNLLIDWSQRREETGHDQNDVEQKFNSFSKGPTTCERFRSVDGNLCAGCVQKVTSPIQLGYDAATPPVTTPMPEGAEFSSGLADEIDTIIPRPFPLGYAVQNSLMVHFVKGLGGKPDAWIPFSRTVVRVIDRVRDANDDFHMILEFTAADGRKRVAQVPQAYLAEPQKFGSALAAKEIYLMAGEKARSYMQEYCKQECLALAVQKDEVTTYQNYGWHEEMSAFVLGDQKITGNGISYAMIDPKVVSKNAPLRFDDNGSVKEWADLVDTIYNRPGAEPYQFAFLVSAASPLIKIANLDNFHGIPVAYTGSGSVGKTTACKMAMTIWGRPNLLFTNAGEEGITLNSINARQGLMNNLPTVYDEMSNRDPKEYIGLMYSFSNGKTKERLAPDGRQLGSYSFDTFSFITSNKCVTELLANADRIKDVGEATGVRVLEFNFTDPGWAKQVFGESSKIIPLIEERLARQYGVVGKELLMHYIRNKDQIRNLISSTRQNLLHHLNESSRERYYINTLTLALVAGAIMRHLGMINFDLGKIKNSVMGTIKELRCARTEREYTDDDIITQYLGSLHDSIIVTNSLPTQGRQNVEAVLAEPRKTPQARHAIKDKKFFVTAKSINDFAKEVGMQPSVIRNIMLASGYIIHAKGRDISGAFNFRIAGGTNIILSATRCYELNYTKIASGVNLHVLSTQEDEPLAANQGEHK